MFHQLLMRVDDKYSQCFLFRLNPADQPETYVDEWRWVPTKMNPADEATKWGSGPYFSADTKWFHGPNFLRLTEDEWPRFVRQTVSTTEEIRPSMLHHKEAKPLIDYERFSRWERLIHMMVYVKRFINSTRSKQTKYFGNPQQEELQAATTRILKMVQHEAYPDEQLTLTNNTSSPIEERTMIERTSVLYQYCSVIDDQGVIRQNSRIRTADHLRYDIRYPVILPKDHLVTSLLIDWYHRLYRHCNTETVVNEIRQSYIIPKLRTMVKKVSRSCQYFKVRKIIPQVPPMAPIPAVRLIDHVRPFTYVGVDYFGPLLVKIGRSNCKRWVALFTCLTVRAVHLEIVHNLSTLSFISCVRRFVSRPGAPVEFFSDNGTNFHGAERILREQISEGLCATFTSVSTRWTFIPPAAPHMGGAWERLVQSVKVAMGEAYSDGKLDEEGFQTLVVEAEGIVNSRPLTYLPLDSEDSEALTPNHFLLGSSTGVKQLAVAIKDQVGFQRETWRKIQR
ncbi:uncharacterized protein LOC129771320 [Toxorhynchites rutilus septentrionalis]|uniref:uncharacterized protein LOC129771320 n=1 Tax=Toxorhynchites rutilus septentrionalis TaxID=329112 RepID=UPI00247AD131|nr:uncharacterized protein LOC129771320 [Toxorhynchites rutilus septentrionalis]